MFGCIQIEGRLWLSIAYMSSCQLLERERERERDCDSIGGQKGDGADVLEAAMHS